MKEKLLNTRAKKLALILSVVLLLVCLLSIYLHYDYITFRETTVTGGGTRSLKVLIAGNKPTVFFSGGKVGNYTLKSNGAITIVPTGVGTYKLCMNVLQKYDSNSPTFADSQGEMLVVAFTRGLPQGRYELSANVNVIGSGVKYNTALMDGVDLSKQQFTEQFTIK